MTKPENNDGNSAVQLTHVTRTYKRDEFEVRALDDVTLDIPRKSFVAIMGPSGSGKTTLLNLVTGIDHATSGRVAVGGEEIATMNEREIAAWRARHIGLVFQFYNLIPVLTAFENVELPLLLTHLSKSERKTHVESALKAVGLADRMGHYPRQLSGGQEQRVAIARAIVTDPTILVADEPTGDLDAKSAEEILILLTQLKTQFDKTIVMVTHDPRSERFVDTVYRLDKGVFTGAEKGGASTKATASERGSWVTITIVLSNCVLSCVSRIRISSADFASKSPVGSSATRMVGSVTIARAMATRCSCPPES